MDFSKVYCKVEKIRADWVNENQRAVFGCCFVGGAVRRLAILSGNDLEGVVSRGYRTLNGSKLSGTLEGS